MYGGISAGIRAFISNAARLLGDVKLLVDAGRYASAMFLATTAREEIAKSYIMVDACRLNLSKRKDVLQALCHAFYDHIAKHAYYKIHRFKIYMFPREITMEQIKELWNTEITRWWPSGNPENGEPDMPHDTYFRRELPLYVDFSDYSKTWITPENSSNKYLFDEMGGINELASVTEMLDRIIKAEQLGLFAPECLSILNDTFRNQFLTNKTPIENAVRLERHIAARVEKDMAIPSEEVLNSPLTGWPLYHFVLNKRTVSDTF